MSDVMMRHLLGSDKKVVHDPGPKGESGEGDACLVMMFLVIAAAGLIMLYGASFPAAGSLTPAIACLVAPTADLRSCFSVSEPQRSSSGSTTASRSTRVTSSRT